MTELQNNIYDEARKLGVTSTLAYLIVAQAMHETANFTSGVFLDCNNAFGYSAIDPSRSCPNHYFYKRYDNISQSVSDLVGWLKRRIQEGNFPDFDKVTSPEAYAVLLKKNNYFTDSVTNYANGLSYYYNSLDKKKLPNLIWAGLLIFLIIRKK